MGPEPQLEVLCRTARQVESVRFFRVCFCVLALFVVLYDGDDGRG